MHNLPEHAHNSTLAAMLLHTTPSCNPLRLRFKPSLTKPTLSKRIHEVETAVQALHDALQHEKRLPHTQHHIATIRRECMHLRGAVTMPIDGAPLPPVERQVATHCYTPVARPPTPMVRARKSVRTVGTSPIVFNPKECDALPTPPLPPSPPPLPPPPAQDDAEELSSSGSDTDEQLSNDDTCEVHTCAVQTCSAQHVPSSPADVVVRQSTTPTTSDPQHWYTVSHPNA